MWEKTKNWFHNKPGHGSDLPCTLEVIGSSVPVDFKFFWVKKVSKQIIAWATNFTPNYEDSPMYIDRNIGVDIFLSPEADRILLVLTNKHTIRSLELHGRLTATQEEILHQWIQSFGSNKKLVHETLWQSFNIKPLNEKFYQGIARSFVELVQHLTRAGINEQDAKLFTNRLIGRLVFCRFLQKKNIIAQEYDYFAVHEEEDSTSYYHSVLSKLFFSTLNLPVEERNQKLRSFWVDTKTPYLNGWLFEMRWIDKDSGIVFPVQFFQEFYAFLDEYNFTTDESTSNYQQVAVDPEMLGRVFENLLAEQSTETGKQARKAKGAFYTPREIVDYMCKESLRTYINQKLTDQSVPESDREKVLKQLFDTSDSDYALYSKNAAFDAIQVKYRGKIIDMLDNLTVIDPACGSWAFPIGMMQIILQCYERILPETKFDPVETKKNIIENSLFGVDIEPMAIEIARLRAWLAIVVDEIDASKVDPLPNLDFKFVCANSLVQLPSWPQQIWLDQDSRLQQNLEEWRHKYFRARSPQSKKNIRQEYEALLHSGLFETTYTDLLKSYNPFDASSPSKFFDPQYMFGKEGFDIVVGNPPYIWEKLNKKTFDIVKDTPLGNRFYLGKMDFFYYFFHLWIDLLHNGGVLSYITTNYFITATWWVKLREDFRARTDLIKLINFGELKVFESALWQHNMITVLEKKNDNTPSYCNTSVTYNKWYLWNEILESIIYSRDKNTSYFHIPQDELYDINWYIKLTYWPVDVILNKLLVSSSRLDKVANAFKGITTWRDSVYVLADQDISYTNSHDIKYLKKWYKNSDISKYSVSKDTSKRVIYLTKYDTNIDNTSFIKDYLNKNKEEIIARKDANLKWNFKKWYWWVLATPRMEIGFETPNIVVPQRSKTNTFGYSNDEFYGSWDIYYITQPKDWYTLKFLLGILNTHLIYVRLYYRWKRKWEMLELFQKPLSEIPIPKITANNKDKADQLESLVEQILAKKKDDQDMDTSEIERQIDDLVYELYELTPDEVKLIEGERK